jgi:hypothetical protein
MWAPPAPAARSRLPLIIAVLVVLVLVIGGGYVAYSYMKAHEDAGKVVFSTDQPVAGQTVGCTIDHQVTTISVGTPVYATYVFSSRQGSAVVTLTVTKDGNSFFSADVPTSDSQGLDCFSDTTDLSSIPDLPLGAGTYTFTLTSGGSTISQGTLTVTP